MDKKEIKKETSKKEVKKETEMQKIRKLDDATILNNIENLKKELFNLRFQSAVGKLENTDRIKKAKKAIARMKTVLNERAHANN